MIFEQMNSLNGEQAAHDAHYCLNIYSQLTVFHGLINLLIRRHMSDC